MNNDADNVEIITSVGFNMKIRTLLRMFMK